MTCFGQCLDDEKAVRLEIKEREAYHEVVGRVHCRKPRECFELVSDKICRRFGEKSLAIARATYVESYAASLGLWRNMRETRLTPDQLREAETAFGLLEGEGAGLMQAALTDELSQGACVPWYAMCLFTGLLPEADFDNPVIGQNVILEGDAPLRQICRYSMEWDRQM